MLYCATSLGFVRPDRRPLLRPCCSIEEGCRTRKESWRFLIHRSRAGDRFPEFSVRYGSNFSVSRLHGVSKPACSSQPAMLLTIGPFSSPVESPRKGDFAEYPSRDDKSRPFLKF